MYRQATKGQTQELITATSKLQKEGQKLQLQSEIADAFLDKFQLKPEEAKIFRGAREGELHPVSMLYIFRSPSPLSFGNERYYSYNVFVCLSVIESL